MDVHGLDVVYFVKDGVQNEELRYSLRSACKNLIGFNRVWIFGGRPMNIEPDIHVKVKQEGDTKWDRVRTMFRMAAENKEITDNFLLFNDDFFIMKPTDHIDPMYRSSLQDYIKVIEDNYMHKPTSYTKLLRSCDKELEGMGATRYAYELHIPFIFNKEKLLKIINDFPDQHCTRTFYGNLFGIGGEKKSDVKIFSDKPGFDYKTSQFLSTDDPVVNVNNDVWRYIKRQFPKKCEYER